MSIKATLPNHSLQFAEKTNFGLCPIRETAKKVFPLKNIGGLATYFEWDIPDGFSITPKKGTLQPETSTNITIEFKPEVSFIIKK